MTGLWGCHQEVLRLGSPLEGGDGPPQRRSCGLAARRGIEGAWIPRRAGGSISLWCEGCVCSGVASRHGLLSNGSWGSGPVKWHSRVAAARGAGGGSAGQASVALPIA